MSSPKVSYSELEDAFLFASYEHQYWLDKRTGEILAFSQDVADGLSNGEDLSDYPEWQQSQIADARRVLYAFGELPEDADNQIEASADYQEDASGENPYVLIEQIPSHVAFEWMQDFIDTALSSRLQQLLFGALSGRRPFRRFKDALLDFPKERDQWFDYESSRRREYIQRWARDKGIEIDFDEQ
ncbi:MAG: UPF0158 family protein [Blastocatellia bacterium]|nr:UPF0158 family protein [Blastocatellia bacterium]